jgi:PAS domain S-box-containing protein
MEDIKGVLNFILSINSTVVALCAIAGHLFVLYKKLKPYTTITDDISKIKAELTSNSGKSLKDLVKKIEVDVESNTNLTKTIMCRQRWILDNRNEPIFEVDEKGNFTWVNEAFIRLTKRSCKELLNKKWKNIIIESQRDTVFEHWNNAIKEKRNFEETIHITNKKGEKFSTMCIATIQEDGKYIGCLTDIKQIN